MPSLCGRLRVLIDRFWGSLGSSWAPLGLSWARLGSFWVPLGRLVALLGCLLAPLGRLLGPLGCRSGGSCLVLGATWGLWASLGCLLTPLWTRPGPFGASLGASCAPLGRSGAAFVLLCIALGASSASLGAFWGRVGALFLCFLGSLGVRWRCEGCLRRFLGASFGNNTLAADYSFLMVYVCIVVYFVMVASPASLAQVVYVG